MKLLIGLGNPGSKYTNTRHNAGFMAVERLAQDIGATDFLYNQKFQAELATGLMGKWQVVLAKPMTFMNKSGDSVQLIKNYYKVRDDDILVVHDDIDIPAATVKLKYAGSHGGHNGVRDIIAKIGTDKFWRLKIGIDRPTHPHIGVVDYVLQGFSPQELTLWDDLYPIISQRVHTYLKNTG